MFVYRLEHIETGDGPYQNDVNYKVHDSGFNDLYRAHPFPYKDGINESKITTDHYFGCETIPLLKDWFHTNQNKWRRYGYAVQAYEVSEEYALVGRRQVAFVRHKATKVGDPVPLHKL